MIARIKMWLKVTPKALLFHVMGAMVFAVVLIVLSLRIFSGESVCVVRVNRSKPGQN